MNEPGGRPPTIGSWIAMGIGLILTVVLFSGYRPWGDTPFNTVLLLGPVILAAAAASRAARRGTSGTGPASAERTGSSASRVAGLGVVMLLIGGCPWLYTPFLANGVSDSASGMLGTIIFLFIGLPGFAVTAIGLVNLRRQRRAHYARRPSASAEETHGHGL